MAILYLQQFRFKISHIPSRLDSADALSRLPVDPENKQDEIQTEEFAYSLVSEAVPAALNPRQVEIASADDSTLQLVRQAVMTDDWSRLQGSTYRAMKDELWIFGQPVMRGDRITMP